MRQLVAADGVLTLRGRLDCASVGPVWQRLMRAATAAKGHALVLDVSATTHCDTCGAALLATALARHGHATLRGAPEEIAALVARAAAMPRLAPEPQRWSARAAARRRGADLADGIAFFGESLAAVVTLHRYRRQLRLADIARLADQAGFSAIPLLVLVGTLIGLILAFQSAIPLRRFGAEIFVVNAVSLSLLRELGPLLAGVILSGRTASAFAAELGTMKVNEELAALETMGISPMRMLVLPRLVAAVLVSPMMTLLIILAGLAGMIAVLLSFGYPMAAISAQLLRAVHLRDLWGGLAKSVVFGAVIAGIGCRAGLATGDGPRAVGLSATRAVVGGIVASIVLDGVFTILFYRLGL